MRYRLEQYVDGEWYCWGTYGSVSRLVEAAFELGRIGVAQVRIAEAEV